MIKTFGEYQAVAMQTAAIYPRIPITWECKTHLSTLPVYPAMAALGEAGELCEKIVEGKRDRLPILNELGDVLWYVTAAAVELQLADPGHELGVGVVHATADTTFDRWHKNHSYPLLPVVDIDREALRLVAMLGKFSERVKKAWRDHTSLDTGECAFDLCESIEIIHRVAQCMYSTLGEVAQANVDKLASRRARGTVQGSGDNR